ncbi:torsin-1A-interacting protein 2-like isoform X4 [Gambusia affinis]|uniref:torsin-1A-interacting protein 2-like isoform X4 n=1 Tax=Gambusia affinis TaxID=33528 RepID=UPI001CDC5FFF|nr:torsin-1A-interacting protein 2-like isoform X4 [Gambusia affinis]
MESPPGYQQPEGSADPSAELSAKPTGEDTGHSSDDVELVDKDDSLQNEDKTSGPQANDESRDNSSSREKSTDEHPSPSVTTGTPTEKETTESSIDDVASVKCDKDDSLQNEDKTSGPQANDESRDNSSNREKSTDEHPSPSVTTGTPTEKETTESSIDDVASVKCGADSDEGNSFPAVDKSSGQQANDESQDNSSSREKLIGEHRSVTTAKSEEVDHPPEMDKRIGYQAQDKRQGYSKGDPSENEKPVDTTPDECANQNLLRTSAVSQKERPNEEIEEQKKKMSKIEDVGPTPTQTELREETGILGGGMKLLVGVAIVALVAIVAQYHLQSESQPQKTDWQQVDVFLKEMKKVKERFPSQRAELWSRSEIHLKRHLQTSQPAEPVSLILTSGVRAEKTMRCLAQGVASAFSTARNASVLHIDGAGKASQDSDQVKLDIDRKLQGAFEGDKPVAVIHRLEELPPGSTLIFYRYCDHENAAYKKTFLIFTVLLGDEEEIPAEMRLSIVEEMVDDYLQKKFLSHGHPVSFDRMDLNKYGGLWSRISHLILPVAAEDRIEHEGC